MNIFKILVLSILLSISALTSAQQRKAPVTPVIVTSVTLQEFADVVEALGTLNAKESVDLTSPVTEIVTKISFTDNQRVKQGDVLVEMDIAEEQAELAEQKSILAEAKRQVKRLTPLVKEGAASASVLDENKRNLEGATARIKAIQARINQRILKAPFDGVLGLRNVSIGALAQPGDIITTIDDDRVMKIDFSVPEIFLATLKPGVVVLAETEAFADKVFRGEIAHVDSRVDPVTRSIRARALVKNEDGLLKPGLLMLVKLQKNPRTALLIPEEALIVNGTNKFVFVVSEKEGKTSVEQRKVELGKRQFGEAEILSGLEIGEQIVTQGVLRIRQGAAVKIVAVENKGDQLSKLLDIKAPQQADK